MKPLLVLLLVLQSSCITLYNRNGDKYRNFAPVSDQYHRFKKTQPATAILPIDSLSANLKNTRWPTRYRYLRASDLKTIQKVHPQFVLLFWLPGCPGQTFLPRLAAKLDSLKCPVYIISETFDLPRIESATAAAGYRDPIIFLLPSTGRDKIILKKIRFIRDLCPSCYDRYRDELSAVSGLFIEGNEIRKVLFQPDEMEIRGLFRSGNDRQALNPEP